MSVGVSCVVWMVKRGSRSRYRRSAWLHMAAFRPRKERHQISCVAAPIRCEVAGYDLTISIFLDLLCITVRASPVSPP